MKTSNFFTQKSMLAYSFLAISGFLMINACTPSESEITESTAPNTMAMINGVPNNAQDSYPLTQSEFNSWFESGTVSKDGMVTAANSLDFSNTNNTDFYKWSSRMFLWITSPTESGERVFDSQTFYDVAPANSDGKRKLIKHEQGVFRNFSPGLRQTRNMDAVLDKSEQGQAGGGDVLMTKNGSLVYYTLMVNDVMAVYRTKTSGTTPLEFPSTSTEIDELVSYGQTELGVTIDDPNALAMELKLSWVEVSAVSNPDDYIQIDASIPVYTKTNDTLWTYAGRDSTATLALTGMHVVGNTKGHPEMLWATFEHANNTPQETYSYVNTGDSTKTVPLSTADGDYLFCAAGAQAPFNVAHMKTSSANIIAVSGQTISASNTTLVNPWGADVNTVPNPGVTSVAQSNSEVISLNSSIMNMLADGDVRENYRLIGCTWTFDGGYPYSGLTSVDGGQVNYPRTEPDVDGLGAAVGTSRLANSTMETYFQMDNCFNCHNNFTSENTISANEKAGGYTDLSHIFADLEKLMAPQSSGEK